MTVDLVIGLLFGVIVVGSMVLTIKVGSILLDKLPDTGRGVILHVLLMGAFAVVLMALSSSATYLLSLASCHLGGTLLCEGSLPT
jgi:hypothetical protein